MKRLAPMAAALCLGGCSLLGDAVMAPVKVSGYVARKAVVYTAKGTVSASKFAARKTYQGVKAAASAGRDAEPVETEETR